MPAFIATTGMPAASAFLIAGISAGGSGMVTARPSTLLSMAAWIRLAWLPEDGSDEYLRSMLSFAAAALAPFWMMSQNVSPGAAWVTMANVIRAVVALPACAPAPDCAAFLPPLLLHAARVRPAVRTAASAHFPDLTMLCLLGIKGCVVAVTPRSRSSDRGREVVAGAGRVIDVRPAGGDDLGPGVERHAFRAVDVLVAEQRVLPPAEGVVGHRHRDRHVDADHAHVHPPLEPPRRLAAGGEDRRAVAVRVGVDQRDRLVHGVGAQHRA